MSFLIRARTLSDPTWLPSWSATPELKKKLRTRMLLEMAADIVLPVPLQMGYHVYQMITLRDI